jgi:hypothetical protein
MNCSVPNVDVHHLRYGNLYDVSTADLMPLCRRCHDAVHASPRLKTLLLSNETSEKKRSLIMGFLAGRDENLTIKVKWQSRGAINDERERIQKRIRKETRLERKRILQEERIRQINRRNAARNRTA